MSAEPDTQASESRGCVINVKGIQVPLLITASVDQIRELMNLHGRAACLTVELHIQSQFTGADPRPIYLRPIDIAAVKPPE